MNHAVYRGVAQRVELFGVDRGDLAVLVFFCYGCFIINRQGLPTNLLATLALLALLRFMKRGKPSGYTDRMLRYAKRIRKESFLSASTQDAWGRANPFPFR